jgi:hypothetical protein
MNTLSVAWVKFNLNSSSFGKPHCFSKLLNAKPQLVPILRALAPSLSPDQSRSHGSLPFRQAGQSDVEFGRALLTAR